MDFSETFAQVARLDIIRILIILVAQNGWKVHQMDVNSTFLNGVLQEEVYVEQLEGFLVLGQEEIVYLLKKAIYGLKHSPRVRYSKMDEQRWLLRVMMKHK